MFIKKLYKFSYTAGTIFLILSIMMSFVPAFPSKAQAGAGAIWTTEGSCGNPQDANQYEIGQEIYIHYENFEAGVPFTWNIVGVSGPDKGVVVASGAGTITYEYDNNTKGCFYAYTVQQGDSGTYKVTLNPEGGNAKTDNYIVTGDEPTPTPLPPTPTPTNTTTPPTPTPTTTDTPPTPTPTTTDTPPTPTPTTSPLPSITVVKSVNPTEMDEPGGSATFTIEVTNDSDIPVTINSIVDTDFGNLNGVNDCAVGATIAAGATYSCSFTRTLNVANENPHNNTVTVQVIDELENTASGSDDATVTFNPLPTLPTITVEKTAFPTTIDEPGGFVDFTFVVTNHSEESVTLIFFNDSVYGNLNQVTGCIGAIGQVIAPEATFSCTISVEVTGDAGDVHTNTVTATARDNNGNGDTATDNATVTITDVSTNIQVTKTANQEEIAEPGGDVIYTVRIDNLTIEAITLTSLTDDIFGDLDGQGTCSVPQTIAGSGFYECEFTGEVLGEAGNAHVNTVTGTAEDNDGGEVSDSDSARVLITDVVPSIEVTKTADPETIPAPLGGVTYTVEIQNLSDEDVTLDSLVDDMFGDLNGAGDCLIGGVIPAGGSYSCSFVENIPGQAGDTHTNVITATVSDNEQNSVNDSDDATVTFAESPELYLVDPCSVGCDQPDVQGQLCNGDFTNAYTGTVDWQIFVGNTVIGQGTLQGVPAGECVALSVPLSGDGLYSVVATLVDEGGATITTSCGPLSCQVEEPPSEPPVDPPTGTPTGVFIPVTGLDLSSNSLIVMLQNLGLALLSFGLVMHGFSLQGRKKSKKQ